MSYKNTFILLIVLLPLFGHLAYAVCPTQERIALNNLVPVFGQWFPQIYDQGWNDTNSDCCIRAGITCNNNSNVVGIELSYVAAFHPVKANVTFANLTYLESLSIYTEVQFVNFVFPSSIRYLSFSFDYTYLATNLFAIPQLEHLYLLSFTQNISMPNTPVQLKSLYVNNGGIINFSFNPQYTQQLEDIYFYSNLIDYNGFFTKACQLPNLKSLHLMMPVTVSNTPFPTCLNQSIHLESLDIYEISGFTAGPIPIFLQPNITILRYSGNFAGYGLPELPANITSYACKDCGLVGQIPQSWKTLNQLYEIDISYNSLNGTFPPQLISSAYEIIATSNQFNNNVTDFLNLQQEANIDFKNNSIQGRLPTSEFSSKIQYFNLNLQYNQIEGYADPWMTCGTSMIPVYLGIGYNNLQVNLSINYYYPSSIPTTDYCDLWYLETIISPIPSGGGRIYIQDDYIFKNIVENLKSKPNIKASNDMPVAVQLFYEVVDMVYIQTIDGQGIQVTECGVVNWNGQFYCDVPYHVNLTIADSIVLEFGGGGSNDLIFPIESMDPPLIEKIVSNVNLDGGYVSVFGLNFGYDYQNATIDFVSPNNSSINCPITSRNSTLIVCQAPPLPKNGNVLYSIKASVGPQSSNLDYTILYQQATSNNCNDPKNPNQICNNHGVCDLDGVCQCANKFFGVYCESNLGKFSTAKPTLSNTPGVKIQDDAATAQYDISIEEIRELNLFNQIVRTFSLKWNAEGQTNNTYYYRSLLSSPTPTNLQTNGHIVGVSTPNVLVGIKTFNQESVVAFANSSIKTIPGTVKYTVSLPNGFPFLSQTNSLQVVFKTSSSPSQDYLDKCNGDQINNAVIQQDANYDNVKWIQMFRGNTELVGKLNNRAISDDRIVYINFHIEVNDQSSALVVANLPHFQTSITMDPDFSTLINVDSSTPSNSKDNCKDKNIGWKVGIIVSSIGMAMVAAGVGTYFYRKKKLAEKAFMNSMNQKLGKFES